MKKATFASKFKELTKGEEPKLEVFNEDFDIDEDIPADWRHVMAAIYQVRCNLFHGGKAYYPEDIEFVGLAYELLWGVWKSFIPRQFRE